MVFIRKFSLTKFFMLQGIKLNNSLPNAFSGAKCFGILEDINTVNTFIGVNNSGKSRFLRTIFSNSKDVKFITNLDENTRNRFKSIYQHIFKGLSRLKRYQIKYQYESQLEGFKGEIESNNRFVLKALVNLYWYTATFDESKFKLEKPAHKNQLTNFLRTVKAYVNNYGNELNRLGTDSNKIDKIYIPILRGLRPIAEKDSSFTNDNIYLNRTQHDYFKDGVAKGTVFTGLSIYEKVKQLLLGDESERNEIREFEEFLETNLFRKRINLIPKYDDDVLHIKIGLEPQFPIYKLGDGLQTLIIILFPLFINRNREHIVFIEEPETHLHPKWQRLLYRSMLIFDKHTYFLSTHSSVFINSKNNSIFIVSKSKKRTHLHYSDIKTEKVAILKELGYKPNDLYQTNYLLWVEGQSDKIYLNYLIQQADDTLVDGEEYSIMFYGGSSYKHFLENKGELNLDFIQSLNQNYALIMDSDRTKSRERYKLQKKAIVDLFKKDKAFCWLTRLREIENYIPFLEFEQAVKSVHKVNNIEIDSTQFGDRCTYINLDAKPNFKAKIKISDELFSKIQRNKDGSLRGVPAAELRKEIEASIKATKKSVNKIDKIKVAERVVGNGFQIDNDELLKTLNALVKDIKKANE